MIEHFNTGTSFESDDSQNEDASKNTIVNTDSERALIQDTVRGKNSIE